MLVDFQLSSASNWIRVLIRSATAPYDGATGLTSATSGLRIAAIANNEATTTAYTSAGTNIETIATLGTFAAPTAGKCRFREVDPVSHPGIYEIQFENSRFAVSNAKSLVVTITGTGLAQCNVTIPLLGYNPYNGANLNLTCLPSANPATTGGLLTWGNGLTQLKPTGGKVELVDGAITNTKFAADALDVGSFSTALLNAIADKVMDWALTNAAAGGMGDALNVLIGLLTPARAGYLDNLSGGAVATAAALSAVNSNVSAVGSAVSAVGVIATNIQAIVGTTGVVVGPTQAFNNTGTWTGNLIGNVTGNVNGTVASVVGTVASVIGSVGSVAGNVGGNVVGSVASVAGNVGGNVVGTVGSVVGSVGSVVGNVGGNIVGNVNGNVVGTTAAVVGNVGGNVVGSVGSVVGNVGGNLNGNVGGNVNGSVASVVGGVTISANGMNAISTAQFSGPADTIPKMIVQMWRKEHKKSTLNKNTGQMIGYGDNGTDVLITQTVTDDGTTQTIGAAA